MIRNKKTKKALILQRSMLNLPMKSGVQQQIKSTTTKLKKKKHLKTMVNIKGNDKEGRTLMQGPSLSLGLDEGLKPVESFGQLIHGTGV